jgi:hypothetical protein
VEEPDPRDFRGWLRGNAERPHEDAKGEGMKGWIRRHGMIASWVHGRVGAFYARRAGEGNEILQIHLCKSMEHIPGYTSMCVFLPRSRVGGW